MMGLREGSDHGVVHEESWVLEMVEERLGVVDMGGWGDGGESEETACCEGVLVEACGYDVGVESVEFGHV